jgi:hypothetical protein
MQTNLHAQSEQIRYDSIVDYPLFKALRLHVSCIAVVVHENQRKYGPFRNTIDDDKKHGHNLESDVHQFHCYGNPIDVEPSIMCLKTSAFDLCSQRDWQLWTKD